VKNALYYCSIAALLVIGGWFLRSQLHALRQETAPTELVPTQPLSTRSASVMGAYSSKVALVEFSEFQCPFCGAYARDVEPAIRKKYVETGLVLIVFRHFPLPTHPLARTAAAAAECAARQGKFVDMHDRLFLDQSKLTAMMPERLASELSLDLNRFRRCADSEAYHTLDSDVASGLELNVEGTPTFFIGPIQDDGTVKVTTRCSGKRPKQDFFDAIDLALSHVK